MADNNTQKKTVEIDVSQLPKGVDISKIGDIIARANKTNERAKKYNEIRRRAQSDLAKMFPKEYKALLDKYHKELD